MQGAGDPTRWSYAALCTVEQRLGVCLPSDLRLLVLLAGWVHPLDCVLNPLRIVHAEDFVRVVATRPEGRRRPLVDFKERTVEGFLAIGHMCGRLPGYDGLFFVGMRGICRERVLQLGKHYCPMTNELRPKHPSSVFWSAGYGKNRLSHFLRYLFAYELFRKS